MKTKFMKSLFFFAGLICVLASASWAGSFESLYGESLDLVPYAVKASYLKYYDKPWEDASFQDRNDFLEVLQKEEIARRKEERREAFDEKQLESHKEKLKAMEKKAIADKEKQRQKEKMAEKKAERKKNKDIKKTFNEQRKKINKFRSTQVKKK